MPDERRRRTRRDTRREGGFGPHGPPSTPERTHRADTPPRERGPSRLRITGERAERGSGAARSRRTTVPTGRPRPRRRRRAPLDVETEVLRRGGLRGPKLLEQLMEAADAFAHDRDRDALRLLRPLRDELPDSPTVRELTGLVQYRLGNYRAAAKELEAFVDLADSVEQHPVLMDCYRAQHRWRRVEQCWDELAAASPSADLVMEGRIVAAGALADRGRLDEAVALLGRKAGNVKKARPHHLRLWYALADIEERAGNLARARALFARVHAHDPEFADVTARRAALR